MQLHSDVTLRTVVILAVFGTIALTFLKLFLYVGLLAPAWKTFKAFDASSERPRPVQVIDLSADESEKGMMETGYRRARIGRPRWTRGRIERGQKSETRRLCATFRCTG